MESKHFLIIIIFSNFRNSSIVRSMEEQRFWSREETGITEFLVDTAKIRTLKLFSYNSKNDGALYIIQLLCEIFVPSHIVLEQIN